MKDLNQQLLEAHIAHELNRFKDGCRKQVIEEEVSVFFEWTRKITLKEVVTVEQILEIIRRNVVELPMPGGAIEMTSDMSKKVLASSWNRKTALEDILARKQFDIILEKAVGLENVRKEVIHRLVNSPAYSRQISEVLFTGIKEYMLTENFVAKKVPGISSLIKAGSFAVSKTLPSLENAIEKKVREYIENNLSKTLMRSERSLNDYFSEPFIAEGDAIWESIARTRLSEYFSLIDAGDLEDFVGIGRDFWLHFRKSPYFRGIYTELVKHFFKQYGSRKISAVLEGFGVTREMVIRELCESLSPLVEKMVSTGYLEERLRARLASFYLSQEVLSLVSPKTSPPEKRGKKKASTPGQTV